MDDGEEGEVGQEGDEDNGTPLENTTSPRGAASRDSNDDQSKQHRSSSVDSQDGGRRKSTQSANAGGKRRASNRGPTKR